MSQHRLLILLLVLIGARGFAQSADGLLLHYACDEGQGAVAADSSTNKLDGAVSTAWAASPSGQALSFDGQPAGVVRVELPVEKRLGKDSWSFSVWLKPTQFTIDDPQNQRRLFACGTYPDAYLVIDLMSAGQPSFYFCYKNEAGATVSAGGTAATGLAPNQWAQVALVCDRAKGQVEFYLNGYSQGSTTLPAGFAGDFSVAGELTLGNGWHNYWGLMDEVRIESGARSAEWLRA
ncbi:MAG: LamG domain-containing protein, partial [Armatimonadota bacterium]